MSTPVSTCSQILLGSYIINIVLTYSEQGLQRLLVCCGLLVLVGEGHNHLVHLRIGSYSQNDVCRVAFPSSFGSSLTVEGIIFTPLTAFFNLNLRNGLALRSFNGHLTTVHTELRTIVSTPVAVRSVCTLISG